MVRMKYIGKELGGPTNYRVHRHSCLELHLILEGSPQQYVVDGQQVTLEVGDVLLVGSNVTHQLLRTADSVPIAKFGMQIMISEHAGQLSESGFEAFRSCSYLKWKASNVLTDIVQYIVRNVDSRDPCGVKTLGHATAIIMHDLTEVLQRELGVERQSTVRERVTGSPSGRLCESVIVYMKDHLDGIPSIELLCSHFAISSRQLSRSFHAYCGESCIKIWNRLRKNYAAELLRDSEYRIEDISEKLGYSNVENFIRFFTREEGMSPARFRRDISADFKGNLN